MIDPDRLAIVLRALLYAGAIGAAGGVLFSLSFPQAARHVERALNRQILVACWLLILVEPLRYVAFQLAIAEGDSSVAFAPAMRWMALQTAVGQASAARLIAAIVLLAARRRWPGVSLAAAGVIIASFGLEGHTVSNGNRLLLAPLLLVHFAAICWWVGALYPLLALIRQAPPEVVVQTVRGFGRRAVRVVAALLAAGTVLLIALSDGELRLDSAYQQRFVVKLTLVAALLSLAAWNKLRLTPLLDESYAMGAAKLRRSIRCEIAVALVILAATAWIIGTSPSP
jgi:putative copper export protein